MSWTSASQASKSTTGARACIAGDRAGKLVGQRVVDTPILRQMIERLVLVEAPHLDRPFDRLSGAVELQPAVGRARDRQHAPVELRGERPVDLQLRQAGGAAFGQGRVVEERKSHRALDLERAIPRQEHDRRMGVDASDLRPPWVDGSARKANTASCETAESFIVVPNLSE